FRQAEAQIPVGKAEVAGKGELEPAAECIAMHCRQDRLAKALDALDQVGKRRRLDRLRELADVGAGDEGAPGAGDHHAGDLRIVLQPAKRVEQALAYMEAERIDRRVVDGQDGNAAVAALGYGLLHAIYFLGLRW